MQLSTSRLNWESEEEGQSVEGEARREDLRRPTDSKDTPLDANGSILTPVLGSQLTPMMMNASLGGKQITEAASIDETMQRSATESPEPRHPPKTAGISPRGADNLKASSPLASEDHQPQRVERREQEQMIIHKELSAVPESSHDHPPRANEIISQLGYGKVVSMTQLPRALRVDTSSAQLTAEKAGTTSGEQTLAKEFSLKIIGSNSRQVLANAVSFAEMAGIESSAQHHDSKNQLATVPTAQADFTLVVQPHGEDTFTSNASQTEPASMKRELREVKKLLSTATVDARLSEEEPSKENTNE